MPSNTTNLDDGQYAKFSSISITASRGTVLTNDLTATSAVSIGGAITISGSSIAPLAVGVGAGAAIGPTVFFNSEASLGLYRSATSQVALSYGTLNATGIAASGVLVASSILISSTTTNQSAASAKVPNQGQILFSILSLTTNGAAMYYRSGNSVFGWASNLPVG